MLKLKLLFLAASLAALQPFAMAARADGAATQNSTANYNADGFAARIGVGRIARGDTAKFIGRDVGEPGFSYFLRGGHNSQGRIDFDALSADRRFTFQNSGITEIRDKSSAFGVSYVQLFSLIKAGRAYAGFGPGAFRVRNRSSFSFGNGQGIDTTTVTTTKTRLGAKALIG